MPDNEDAGALETLFLEGLDEQPLPAARLTELVLRARTAGGPAVADPLAEMLRAALVEQRLFDELVALLRVWAAWRDADPAFRLLARESLERAASTRLRAALARSAGWDAAGTGAGECLRRLDVLMKLVPGALCHDGTWGFGVVRQVDDLYARVVVDFRRKAGHAMSFGYAGETLELLDENHFQSRLHRDREALGALARDNPADVVRLVLASHGPLAVVALRETLVPDLLADAEWDAFWDAARKGLKASGAVTIPARRSEPLRLADAERQSFDAPWFARLSAERSREAILAAAAELAAAGRRFEAGSPETAVLADRIAHACRGAESRAPHIVAQLLVAAGRLGIPAERHDAAALLATLLAPATLAVCLTRLPARAVGEWLAYAAGAAPDALSAALLAALHDLPAGVMADVMKAVAAMGAEERLAGGLRTEIHRVRPGAGILLWLLKNPAWVRGRQLTDEATLFNLGIECLEAPGGGETLKAQKAMRELYTDEVWLRAAMEPMTRLQRENAVRRLSTSPGWDPASRRSVLARVLRAFPDLSAVLVPEGGRAAGGAAAAPANRFTSWRMLTARQAQLRRLVEVDLPANSRDIAVARSYGDLRENFEYQAAKDQQRLLLRRKDELEADLAAMKGTDFEGAPVDRVGPGVEVRVRRASGAESVFRVLGEWDSDAALGIVASGSLVGQRLAGRQVGDTVRLPADNGEEECRIEGVGPLPAEVQDWTRAGEARNAGAERTVADGAAQ